MPPCFCSSIPPSTSISKFISDQPYLTMLETKCTTMKDLQKIHAQLIKTGLIKDRIAASRVLAFCAISPASDINYAYLFFTRIEKPTLFTWNTIIRGFSQSSNPQIAISLFIDMLVSSVEPQSLTYPSVFKAYTQLGLAQYGAQLHGRVIKVGLQSDEFIRNTVVHMYANSGFLEEASKLFDEDEITDVVAWNSMIMGHAKSGKIDESWRMFGKMPSRNEVSWNSMISGYVRNGKWIEALELFREMQHQEGIKPSEFTLVSLLNACARLGALKQGEWIHDYIKKNDIELNTIVITAIIDMYSKCGNIKMARNVFEGAPGKGLSCWNSMILGLAMNGFQDDAIELFSRLESSNLKPDEVSFIGLLTACNHSGLVQKAKDYFKLMTEGYEIKPSIKQYGCMVDILSRAGHIEEAKELIKSMPMEPDAIIWGCLLSACRYHGNIEMAKWAADHLIQLDPNESSGYVLMSNVYAACGEFTEAVQERISMKEKHMKKQPGCSLIEVNGVVHEFLAGGNSEEMKNFELSHYLS